MPYLLLGQLLSLVLLATFLLNADVSLRTKAALVALFALSVGVPWIAPAWALAGFLMQMLLAIGISLYFKARR